MKTIYSVNQDLLKQKLKEDPEGYGAAKLKLALAAKISEGLVNRILCGHVPGAPVRYLSAQHLGIEESELFPEAEGEAA